jgi:hypothetical protein
MNEERIMHVSVKNGTKEELSEIRDIMRDEFPNRQCIITDDTVDVTDFPPTEEFIDAFVDRAIEEMQDEVQKPNFSERL